MDRHDGFAARCQAALGVGKVDKAGAGIDVNQHHLRAKIADNLRSCREGQSWHDHAVTRSDATGLRRQVQASGRGVDSYGFDAVAKKSRELLFEFSGLGARGQPAAAQDGGDCVDLIRGDSRPEEGYVHNVSQGV